MKTHELTSAHAGPRRRVGATVLLALALLVTLFGRASAHETGTLKLVSKTFRAGDSLLVVGSKFSARDEVALVLVGVSGRIALGDIPTDTAGAFRRMLLVPRSAARGQYRLVAEALDGDVVASVEVVVEPASTDAPMASMANMPGMVGHDAMEMEPTGEPLALAHARSGVVTSTAILLVIACASAGAMLLRRPRANPSRERS